MTGQSAFEYAKKELFEPLGVKSAKWGNVDAQGVSDGEAGLFLSAHDMARIGYLYLHNGLWEGKQLIPSSWVERAMSGPSQRRLDFIMEICGGRTLKRERTWRAADIRS